MAFSRPKTYFKSAIGFLDQTLAASEVVNVYESRILWGAIQFARDDVMTSLTRKLVL